VHGGAQSQALSNLGLVRDPRHESEICSLGLFSTDSENFRIRKDFGGHVVCFSGNENTESRET
jgi:hypothetical protein